jgi:predicted AAA+ superfamily ATPase
MTASFYPPHLCHRFTNRVGELNFLQGVAEDLAAGRPRCVALRGLRRAGKTLLIRKQNQSGTRRHARCHS